MEDRHAYLIMCHNNPAILRKLLALLDDPRNDLYIHADSKWTDFLEQEIKNSVSRANVEFINRRDVTWGGFSQIQLELDLLKAATKKYHSYYHLISGVDLPIKTQDEIYRFFAENHGKQYIGFDADSEFNVSYLDRVRYYHPFQEIIGRRDDGIYRILRTGQGVMVMLQEKLRMSRVAKLPCTFYKGPNWFSITHELAKYVLDQCRFIRKHFSMTVCADEMFLQTVAMMSPYRNSVENCTLRYIDWERGSPYTFCSSDYQQLCSSECMFARKFDAAVDEKIVDLLYERAIKK